MSAKQLSKSKLEEKYVAPKEAKTLVQIEHFKDLKLGFMTHLGLYNQIGFIESWALSDEEQRNNWSQWGIDWTDRRTFKKQYYNLNKSFNPMRLEPDRWAQFAQRNGFKYALLPTKHHDGFCLWDTKETDYKVTASNVPFASNKYADIFGSLCRAFQRYGIETGAYFSKSDWYDKRYWPDEFKLGTTHKHIGYDPQKNQQLFQQFREFTKAQMIEIVSNYAPIDILWLDGAQVGRLYNQDIDIDEIRQCLLAINPNLLVVDRMNPGVSENYLTPEQTIPDTHLNVPWESCISLGSGFAYGFDDKYKSAKQITATFVEILCKGGNLALNIAPQGDGRLPAKAIANVEQFGMWVTKHQKAIYSTRPIAPYWQQNCGTVRTKAGQKYLFVLPNHELLITPKYVYIKIDINLKRVLYYDEPVVVTKFADSYRLTMPKSQVDSLLPLCFVFAFE